MRYFSQGVPTVGAGAFLPVPSQLARSWGHNKQVVRGGPRVAVEAPIPSALIGNSATPASQGSHMSPEIITPSQYIATVDNMAPPVPIRPREEMPLPAINPGRIPRVAFTAPQIGGFYIPMPSTTPWWVAGQPGA